MIWIPPHVKIVVEGSQGEVRHSQTLQSFLTEPSINVQMAAYGNTLLDILTEESYISENLAFKYIITGNVHADATRIIGSIAESLVVNLCNSNPEINRTLGMYARLGKRPHKTLDDYVAVATGSMRTKNLYQQHYNPTDTQRDVIWVEKDNTENQLLCIDERKNNKTGAKPAGLQVKASHDGINYVLPSIENYHYPVLYFDLNGDWGEVQKALLLGAKQATLINPDELRNDIKNTLKGYFNIVVALLNNQISIQRIIEECKYYGDSNITSGLDGAEATNDSKLILPNRINRFY